MYFSPRLLQFTIVRPISHLISDNSEVPFHRISLSYSYFEFLHQFSKKQIMIKKQYQLNRNEKFVEKASNVLPFYTASLNPNLLYSLVDSLKGS